jgi:hypothetical protein
VAQEASSPGKKRFHKRVDAALAKGHSLLIHYKKLNGRTVKRKIEPRSWRGHTLVAYDHKRKAVRSFRMERVKHMEKAAGMNYYRLPKGHPHYHLTTQSGPNAGAIASVHPVKQWEQHKVDESSMTRTGGPSLNKEAADEPKHDPATFSHWASGLGKRFATIDNSLEKELIEKKAFWVGFSKQASDKHKTRSKYITAGSALGGAGAGALTGAEEGFSPKHTALLAAGGGVLGGLAGYLGAKRSEKHASAFAHAAELGGLGVLAAPAIQHLRGKEMSEGAKAKTEVAGLGILAAPSLHAAGKGLLAKAMKR